MLYHRPFLLIYPNIHYMDKEHLLFYCNQKHLYYKILHFNIGVTYDNISNKYHDESKHDLAFNYMNKAIVGYENAIKLDSTYVDAYYNLGALYYNQSITSKSVAGDYSGEKYDLEMKKADNMLKKAIPLLEKVLTFSLNDKSTLKVLKSLYLSNQSNRPSLQF